MFVSDSSTDVVVLDAATPPRCPLSAFYKRSFAYQTVKERLPRILTQIIDNLVRHKDIIGIEFGNDAKEELKTIIGKMSKLKYEIQTNKAIRTIQSDASDVKFYNQYLEVHPNITYFNAIWLYTESYMYRRIQEMCELSHYLKDFDCFQIQKQESFKSNMKSMEQVGSFLLSLNVHKENNIKEAFIKLLKLNLWSNKADLSFSSGHIKEETDPFELLQLLEPNILCDHSERIWNAVLDLELNSQTIDIVLDNAGYELFTDLCIADFILTNKLAENIRLYVKTCPYFISDVTKKDFDWTITTMKNNSSNVLQTLGYRWTKYIEDKQMCIIEDDFWITALDYSCMNYAKPNLYHKLSEAKIIIFKGDLNYRKLIGEKNWEPTLPLNVCLQGFMPTKLCILRTLKSDIVCGLEKDVVETIERCDTEWMVSGNYGVIQCANYVNV